MRRDPLIHSSLNPDLPEGRTRVTVNLDQFVRNVHTVLKSLRNGEELLPVIKANAYGHGLLPIMQALSSQGQRRVAVMGVDEALALREGGFPGTIVLLGGFSDQEISLCIREHLTPVLHQWDQVGILEACSREGARLNLHLKVDTGMGRLGFLPEDLPLLLDRLARLPHVRLEGFLTHFPQSEDPGDTQECMDRFQEVLVKHLSHPAMKELSVIHMANSGALMHGKVSFGTPVFQGTRPLSVWARPGLILYGHLPMAEISGWEPIRPVMSVEARLLSVRSLSRGHSISYGRTEVLSRNSRIGVLGMGYADGLSREISGKGWGVIDGRKVPFVGRICMDMVAVDLTDLPREVSVGEWVGIVLPDVAQSMTVDLMAQWMDTIPYEVLCLIGHRADRRYVGLPHRENRP